MTHPLLLPAAQTEATTVVQRIEAGSSAEVVVVVTASVPGGEGRAAVFGGACALVALLVLLYAPPEVALGLFSPLTLLAAVVGGFAAWRLPPLRRWLLGRTAHGLGERAAKVAFVDHGVSATRGRSGLLVHAAIDEGVVAVVLDVGIAAAVAGDSGFAAARAALEASLRAGGAPAFFTALEGLAAPLATLAPRADDDENELADGLAAGPIAGPIARRA